MKRCAVLFLGCIILLCSCQAKLPEGDIKNFVESISYEKSYEEVLTGKSETVTSHYVDGILDGSVSSVVFFDKEEKYYYERQMISGSYYGSLEDQFDYHSKESICCLENNIITYKENKDETKTSKDSDEEELTTFIESFFFKDFSASYHGGGMYYGDYILLNVAKYYNCFNLSKDKKELSFSVNTSAKNEQGEEIITMHSFSVNEYGMLLKLETKSFFAKDADTYILTIINCQYDSVSFDKIWNI